MGYRAGNDVNILRRGILMGSVHDRRIRKRGSGDYITHHIDTGNHHRLAESEVDGK